MTPDDPIAKRGLAELRADLIEILNKADNAETKQVCETLLRIYDEVILLIPQLSNVFDAVKPAGTSRSECVEKDIDILDEQLIPAAFGVAHMAASVILACANNVCCGMHGPQLTNMWLKNFGEDIARGMLARGFEMSPLIASYREVEPVDLDTQIKQEVAKENAAADDVPTVH